MWLGCGLIDLFVMVLWVIGGWCLGVFILVTLL